MTADLMDRSDLMGTYQPGLSSWDERRVRLHVWWYEMRHPSFCIICDRPTDWWERGRWAHVWHVHGASCVNRAVR